MRESFAALLTQIRKVWLNRRFVFPIALLLCAIGWTVVALLPDVYEGTATLYVDPTSMLGRVLGNVAVNTEDLDAEFVALARQQLLARPNIQRLVRETDLDLGAAGDKEMERLLDDVTKSIDIQTASTSGKENARPNIFLLQARHKNPAIAKKMVESLVDIFGESVIGSTRAGNDQTQQFLATQIAQVQKKLDDTEQRIKEFRSTHPGLMPTESNAVFSDLNAARREQRQVDADLSSAIRQQELLRRQLGASSGRSDPGVPADVSAKYQQWSRLDADLQALLARYTEEHPQVIAVRKRIAELNYDPRNAHTTSNVARSPVDTSTLQMELFRVEGEVESLRNKQREVAAQASSLGSSVSLLPEVESELQTLTRDYDLNKGQYTALVQRQESARLSREAELTTNQAQFQVIEPPHAGLIPVEPKRGLLFTGVLAGSLGIAAGLGFLLSQIKPTFGDVRELEAVTGLSAYGTIGVVRNATDTRKHRIEYIAYIAAFASLLLAYVGLLAWMADDFKALLG